MTTDEAVINFNHIVIAFGSSMSCVIVYALIVSKRLSSSQS